MAKFTNHSIEKLKCPRLKPLVYLWDPATPGLGVRCTNNGVKSFVLRYRLAGRQRIKTIGRVKAMDISKAIKKSRTLLGDIYAGKDPFSRKGGVIKTVLQLSEAFQVQRAHELKPKTLQSYESLWIHINGAIGKVGIEFIDADSVAKLRKRLKDSPTTFNRCVALILCGLKWYGIGTDNHPLKQVKRFKEKTRQRILSQDENMKFYASLMKYKGRRKAGWKYADLVILLLLTGLRRDEWRLGRWEWLDIENRLYIMPDNKTGGRTVYLSEPATERIRDLHEEQGKPVKGFIFPAVKNKRKAMSWTWRQWDKIRNEAGLPNFRIHDLRHTAGSYAHSAAGLTQRQVADFLGHTKLETSSRYIHDTEKRKASDAAGQAISDSWNLD